MPEGDKPGEMAELDRIFSELTEKERLIAVLRLTAKLFLPDGDCSEIDTVNLLDTIYNGNGYNSNTEE